MKIGQEILLLRVSVTFLLMVEYVQSQAKPWKITPIEKQIIADYGSNVEASISWEGLIPVGKIKWSHFEYEYDTRGTEIITTKCEKEISGQGNFMTTALITSSSGCKKGIATLAIPSVTNKHHGILKVELDNGQEHQLESIDLFLATTPTSAECDISHKVCICFVNGVYGVLPSYFTSEDGTYHSCHDSGVYVDRHDAQKLSMFCQSYMGKDQKFILHVAYFKENTHQRVDVRYPYCNVKQEPTLKITPLKSEIVLLHGSNLDATVSWEGYAVKDITWDHYIILNTGESVPLLSMQCKTKATKTGNLQSVSRVMASADCTSGTVTLSIPKVTKRIHGFLELGLHSDTTFHRAVMPVYIASRPRSIECRVTNGVCRCLMYGVYGRMPLHFTSGDGTNHTCEESGLYEGIDDVNKFIQFCYAEMKNAAVFSLIVTYYNTPSLEKVVRGFPYCKQKVLTTTVVLTTSTASTKTVPITSSTPSTGASTSSGVTTPPDGGDPYPDIIISPSKKSTTTVTPVTETTDVENKMAITIGGSVGGVILFLICLVGLVFFLKSRYSKERDGPKIFLKTPVKVSPIKKGKGKETKPVKIVRQRTKVIKDIHAPSSTSTAESTRASITRDVQKSGSKI